MTNIIEILEMILNNVYSGIIFCDTEVRIIFMNEVYAQLLNVDRAKAVGKHVTEYFPESSLSIVLESGSFWTRSARRRYLQGGERRLLW